MSLTGAPLLVLLAVLSVAMPIALAVWSIRRRRRDGRLARWGAGLGQFVGIVLCQILLVGTVFVAVNRSEGFYTSWGDLIGTSHENVDVHHGGNITPPPVGHHPDPATANVPAALRQGKVVTLTVHGRVSLVTMPVQAWLPPQYFDTKTPRRKFPAVMFLPGYPGSPGAANAFHLVDFATQAIRAGRVEPFVMIFPPITIRPGLDTECVNFPGGPRAESWLTHDVRDAALRHFRIDRSGRDWAISGWSTGGFCATNLYLRNPKLFHAAVSIGGYFIPAFDRTDNPELSSAEQSLVAANSPLHTFRTDPPSSARLLLITSKEDQDSWQGKWYADSRQMAALTRQTPGVSQINLSSGGHHVATYLPALPPMMTWLGQQGL